MSERNQEKRARSGDDGSHYTPRPAADTKTTKVWTAIEPPRITSFSHQALAKWLRAREEYVDTVHDRCKETKERPEAVMLSVIRSVDKRLLKTLCTYEWNITIEELTDERFCIEINKVVNSIFNDEVPDLHALMRERLRMNLRERDVTSRVQQYFDMFERIVEDEGLSLALLQNEKLKCKLLVDNLKPDALQEQVVRIQQVDQSTQENSLALYRLVKQEAIKNQSAFELARRQRTGEPSGAPRSVASGRHNAAGNQGSNPSVSARQTRATPTTAAVPSSRGPAGDQRARLSGGCLFCHGDHRLAQCPTATADDKKSGDGQVLGTEDGGNGSEQALWS